MQTPNTDLVRILFWLSRDKLTEYSLRSCDVAILVQPVRGFLVWNDCPRVGQQKVYAVVPTHILWPNLDTAGIPEALSWLALADKGVAKIPQCFSILKRNRVGPILPHHSMWILLKQRTEGPRGDN